MIRRGQTKFICPDPECKQIPRSEDLRPLVSAETFKMICLFCSARRCFKNDCSRTREHLLAIDVLKRTTKLNQKKSAFLKYTTSTQAARRKAEDAQHRLRGHEAGTKREKARTTKPCPRASRIERNSGCGHFICNRCNTEFCWCYKVLWENKTLLHLVGCRIRTTSTADKQRINTRGYKNGWDRDEGTDLSLDEGL